MKTAKGVCHFAKAAPGQASCHGSHLGSPALTTATALIDRCRLIETVPPPSDRNSLDDVIDAYKPGIDVTLIDENLRLSVDERLRCLQHLLDFAEELRRAGRELPPKR